MGLMDLMNDVAKDFDPEQDKVTSGPQVWPNGTYTVMLGEMTGYRQNKFHGGDEINIELEIVDGDMAGQKDFHALSFDETTSKGTAVPAFVIQKNIKEAMQLFAATETPVEDSDWEDTRTLGEALEAAIGKPFELEFSTAKNKKKPDYPYKNYNYTKLEDAGDFEAPAATTQPSPFEGGEEVEIDDDDLPF